VLIWGYAENGVGMIVGCVATLRPLFRRIFNLDGNSVPERTPKDHTVWGSANAPCNGRGEDWVMLYEQNDTRVKALKSSTQLRHSESEESILGTGIKITKTIMQNSTRVEEDQARYGSRRN
jgi:hypothetical protein